MEEKIPTLTYGKTPPCIIEKLEFIRNDKTVQVDYKIFGWAIPIFSHRKIQANSLAL